MKRSRLKNIINKSKTLSKKQEVGNPFDEFKKSLPIEVDDNYRLEAAWKAYGSPKDYKAALWEGMIQPIDENNYKLPSIGYNEETDEYEYLNKGEDNETVAKDIRVWDNDVIPFVKELKHGGYIRKFNKEKDCWTYTKNLQKEDTLDQNQGSPEQKEGEGNVDYLKQGGKTKKYKTYQDFYNYLKNTERLSSDYDMEGFYNDPEAYFKWEELEDILPGKAHFTDKYKLPEHYTFSNESKYATLPYENGGGGKWEQGIDGWTFTTSKFQENIRPLEKYINYFAEREPESSLIYGGKKYYPNQIKEMFIQQNKYDPLDYIKVKEQSKPYQYNFYKQGGQMNVIPEGALHARKNNMEGAGEDFTTKGIPVVDNQGEQQAEIEKNEVIFTKELTDFIENNLKKFNSDETSNSEKDEIAIKVGKRLVKELLTNTDDRTGLISEVEQKM